MKISNCRSCGVNC